MCFSFIVICIMILLHTNQLSLICGSFRYFFVPPSLRSTLLSCNKDRMIQTTQSMLFPCFWLSDSVREMIYWNFLTEFNVFDQLFCFMRVCVCYSSFTPAILHPLLLQGSDYFALVEMKCVIGALRHVTHTHTHTQLM